MFRLFAILVSVFAFSTISLAADNAAKKPEATKAGEASKEAATETNEEVPADEAAKKEEAAPAKK